MNMAGINKVTKKMALPLIVAATMLVGVNAWAQGLTNGIASIVSDQQNQLITASGVQVDIRITLYGTFEQYALVTTPTLQPEIRMIVNGNVGWASLVSMSPYTASNGKRTEALFRYTVKPGDMAAPLALYGFAGVGSSPGASFQFNWNGWQISQVGNPAVIAKWVFDPAGWLPSDVYDYDLKKAKVRLKTLAFDDANSPITVAATETVSWRVTTVNPIESSVVDFYVWPADYSLIQVGANPNQPLLISMPTGSTEVDFPVRGRVPGSTDIYLQRTVDYNNNANNGTLAGVTNYIRRTITVTAPPEPTVRVVMIDNGSDNITMNETGVLSSGNFRVELSETYATDVYVQIDTAIAGTPQSSVTFASNPFVVRIPAGDTVSPDSKFNVPDGTQLSAATGVTLTPTIQDPTAAAYFVRVREATVYVNNLFPVITRPESTDLFTVTRGVSTAFPFTVADVPADRASMITRWNFGDSTPELVVTGYTGSAFHTYATTGNKIVTVQAEDKDGALSTELQFNVTVQPPLPQPSVSLVTDRFLYNETTATATGEIKVYISESFIEDVWVRIVATPAGQANIVLSTTNAFRIAAGTTNYANTVRFSVVDGTVDSALNGITLSPVVTNAAAAAHYTDLKETSIYINNVDPVITRPLPSDLGQPADSTYGYDQIAMSTPFTFNYNVTDVVADRATMALTWNFGDGSTLVVTGANGTVSHTYTSLGDRIVSVQAEDKDGGISTLIEFKVTVVTPPPDPTVRVLAPASQIYEDSDPLSNYITVQLTEAFTNLVVVDLTMDIAGKIALSQNQVIFGVGETAKDVYITTLDGTSATLAPGVKITPNVIATPAATNYFLIEEPGYVRVRNVAPVIVNPAVPAGTDPAYTVPQGAPWTYYWDIDDVAADLLAFPPATTLAGAMQVTWFWGDGTTSMVTGGSGSISHTYSMLGEAFIRVRAIDKDGASMEIQFSVLIQPAKAVNVTPIGPNREASYYGAAGIGDGTVVSTEARSSENRNNVYFFKYDPNIQSATLAAIPYKAGLTGYTATLYDAAGNPYPDPMGVKTHDSFFYVWAGVDQGLPEEKLVPSTTTPTTAITLPEVQAGDNGTVASVEIRDVQAIFSFELYEEDNMGDINLDGIPDKISQKYGLAAAAAAASANPGGLPDDLVEAGGYNGDEDYIPLAASGNSAVTSNIFATLGQDFTALLEVRGFDPGLNNHTYGSDPVDPMDEPGADGVVGGTNPLIDDTDGDNFPDGWEYYFWYNAKFKGLTGESYNPADVGQGNPIESKFIEDSFNPLVPAIDTATGNAFNRDLDNDGLTDVEELTAGTNPVHWDTDGDGMCDGWEILRGLNPSDPDDGLSTTAYNPDGDYMAYASVPRQWVTVVGNGITNNYLAVGAAVGETNGTFTTWYNYGDTNSLIAVGRPIALEAGAAVTDIADLEALIMHFQVRDEFGFDPRTAWIDEIDNGRFANTTVQGAAPNTRPFTSLDEYLLMKFMSENRLNGIGASIPPKAANWNAASTNPRTPDSDASAAGVDSIPDGWELYVATAPGTRVFSISPWTFLDNDDDLEPGDPRGDGLDVKREFSGIYPAQQYAAAALYSSGFNTVSITLQDPFWVNKFWPTNPWSKDTDEDGVSDSAETAFMYNNAVDSGGLFTAGGGLNPCTKDTDRDALPDAWELQFTRDLTDLTVVDGMDGTVVDFGEDWDLDGLENYQEYWVQAVRSFRYDIPTIDVVNTNTMTGAATGNAPLPMDYTFNVSDLFVEIVTPWDIAIKPWGPNAPTLWVMLKVNGNSYVSTDPRMADTDGDSMDDYYEMYHGLNPILGMGILASGDDDRVGRAYITQGVWTIDYGSLLLGNDFGAGLPRDFVSYPWMTGMPESDPDSDGLINFEEQLLANVAAPNNYNTDPTPLWMTDYSSPFSYTYSFYFNNAMFFWPGTAIPLVYSTGYSMFEFEMNEGYDTDNDGLSDKDELIHSRNPVSDPRNHDDPERRQAMWFSGANSVARTIVSHSYDEWSFRSFTVELWARPEVLGTQQVILERSVPYRASDLSDTTLSRDRKTFQIGIEADGRIYAKFDNAGSEEHDSHTATVRAYGGLAVPGEWMHIAARMDGASGQFDILVNGELRETVDTAMLPANGVVVIDQDPANGALYVVNYPGTICIGASDINPQLSILSPMQSWASFELFYRGYVDEVRIWDGARALNEIYDDMYARYNRADLENNRETVEMERAWGGTRIIGDNDPLSPEILYHYTFDNIFSAVVPGDVATAPRGFMDPAVTINRPAGSNLVALGYGYIPMASTVYTNYQYMTLIENGVDHLPVFGGLTVDGDSIIQVQLSDTVSDSIYWSETQTGGVPAENFFPNNNNPYGISYLINDFNRTDGAYEIFADLVPMGDAFAQAVPEMWDNQGPSAPWVETGTDDNSDGLPDWWTENVLGIYTNLVDVGGWNDLYPDGSGMTNGEKYQRDIANGATASNPTGVGGLIQVADIDGDGMPDWWEDLFAINKQDATGTDGSNGDLDRDGLPNLAEYLISEVYQFRYLSPRLFRTAPGQPVSDYFLKEGQMTYGAMFTDHDFVEDYWEDLFDPYYVNSYVYDAHEDNDEDGWSNWAEARFASAYRNIDPDSIVGLLPEMQTISEYPIPVIETTLRYSGFQGDAGGNLVINAYTTPDMDGKPDATYTFAYAANGSSQSTETYAMGAWQPKKYYVTLSPGSVAPGTITMTFTDQFNHQTVNLGYDVDGVVYATIVGGMLLPVGSIDYETGTMILDLSIFEGGWMIITDGWDDTLPDNQQSRDAYVLISAATVEVRYSVNLSNTWPKTLYLGKSTTGFIREGQNYFFAFLDLDANGTWNAGEPCGIPEQFATDIGWDKNEMAIELTDYRDGYLRLDLTTGLRSEDVLFGLTDAATPPSLASSVQRVRVWRKVGNNAATVLDREITAERTYLHEGDLLAQADLALDWNVSSVDPSATMVAYSVYVGDNPNVFSNLLVTSFTNVFDSQQAAAVSTKPINGGYVYSARPVFKWTMPDNYPAFAIEIKKGSPTGPTVYSSGAMKAPSRHNETGEYIWEAPIHAGDTLPSGHIFSINTVYAWRVTTLDAKYATDVPDGTIGGGSDDPCSDGSGTGLTSSGWSAWKMFRLDVNTPVASSGYGMINATVKYFGPVDAGNLASLVKVQAYTTRDFTGVPDAQYTLTSAELGPLTDTSTTNINAVLRGLTPSEFAGRYFVMAYIDSNNNNVRDVWESWGYANYYGKNILIDDEELDSNSIFRDLYGGKIAPYVAYPVNAAMSTLIPKVTVYIEDVDTDQDWFPDAWEYQMNPGENFLEPIGPSATWDVNMGNTEVNPDLVYGSTPWASGTISLLSFGSTDSDGDGIDDFKELILGTDVAVADSPAVVDNLLLGLAPEDTLKFSLTGLGLGSSTVAVEWALDVNRTSTSISPAMLNLMSASPDGNVNYYVDYTESLSAPDWVTVQHGTVTLEGSKTLVEEINAAAINASRGFFRVRLAN